MSDLLHVFTGVRNEGRWFSKTSSLIEYFLRHYLEVADRVTVVIDPETDDDTVALCHTFGKRVIVEAFPSAGLNDTQMVEYAARRVAFDTATYALWVDCDEFLRSQGDLRRELEAHAQADHKLLVAGNGYWMVSRQFPTCTGQIWDEVTMGVREEGWAKPVMAMPNSGVIWTPGKHALVNPRYPLVTEPNWDFVHLRLLGEAYHLARNARNWARVPEAERRKGHGYHTGPDYIEIQRTYFRKCMAEAYPIYGTN